MAMMAAQIAASLESRPEVGHERAVDLERLDGEVLEIGERRIARAEVVDGHVHAELAHRAHGERRGGFVDHQQALGDFELEAGARQSGFVEMREHPVGKARRLELRARDVHGHAQVAASGLPPFGDLLERLAHHLVGELHDEAGFFGHRNEFIRRHDAARRDGASAPALRRWRCGRVATSICG